MKEGRLYRIQWRIDVPTDKAALCSVYRVWGAVVDNNLGIKSLTIYRTSAHLRYHARRENDVK